MKAKSIEYWVGVFKSCGFVPFTDRKNFPEGKWFLKGKLYIGDKSSSIDLSVPSLYRAFHFCYNKEDVMLHIDPPKDIYWILDSQPDCFIVSADEFFEAVHNLAEPQKWPLLLGIDWAKPIVTEMLKEGK